MEKYLAYKEQVLACTRWLSEHGYFGALRGTGGNVSMRIAGEDALAVTPSTLPYDKISPAEICIVDFDLKQMEGDTPPSVEAGMHLAVYKNRPDVNAVIHTHQLKASAFALLNRPIPALFDEVALHLGPVVAVIPYALSGSPELVENVAGKLSNGSHGYIIQNHGALCLGATLDKAWLNVELLEKTAQAYLDALSTGQEVTVIPKEIEDLLILIRQDAQAKEAEKNQTR
ncbi:MAG: class II aldolase/adducin family protein [Desulfobacterales bacterium]|nr:class II aldolase/adducin family protein [Desulfobacterales bacterium]